MRKFGGHIIRISGQQERKIRKMKEMMIGTWLITRHGSAGRSIAGNKKP